MKLKPMAKARSRIRSLERQVQELKAELAAREIVEAQIGDGVMLMKRSAMDSLILNMPIESVEVDLSRTHSYPLDPFAWTGNPKPIVIKCA